MIVVKNGILKLVNTIQKAFLKLLYLPLQGDPILFQHLFLQAFIAIFFYYMWITLSNLQFTIPAKSRFISQLTASSSLLSTKSNFNFDSFYEKYKLIVGKSPCFNHNWLTWFIGFTEGDGSFIITKRGGDPRLVIVQDTRDIQVLYMIQKTLAFGRVIKQGKTTSRFIVQDKKGLYLLCLLFNGNIVTKRRAISFKKFLLAFNKYSNKGRIQLKAIDFQDSMVKPAKEDSWISGFVDSEGCFHVGLSRKNNNYNISFDLSQQASLVKNEESGLELLVDTFKVGKITKHSLGTDVYSYRISGLSNTSYLFSYFDTHKLRSKKLKSYLLWRELHAKLTNKEHLDSTLRPSLKILASKVNNTWD